jgi:hypothetical protein
MKRLIDATIQWKEILTHTMMDPSQQAYLIIRKQQYIYIHVFLSHT